MCLTSHLFLQPLTLWAFTFFWWEDKTGLAEIYTAYFLGWTVSLLILNCEWASMRLNPVPSAPHPIDLPP